MLDDERNASEATVGEVPLSHLLAGKEALARRALKIFLQAELFIVFLAWFNTWLDGRRSWVIPDGLISLLHYLVLPCWVYAAIKVVDLVTLWVMHDYRPKNLLPWSVTAGAILLLLPFMTHYLAMPVNTDGAVSNCMAQQRNIIAALQSHDNLNPELPLKWTADSNMQAKWLVCPGTKGLFHNNGGYGFNGYLVGRRPDTIPDPRNVVMVADSIVPGMLLYSDTSIDRTRHRYHGLRGYVCGFVDGHIEFRTADTPATLKF